MKTKKSIKNKIFKYSSYLSVTLVLLIFIIMSFTYYKQILELEKTSSINELKYIEEEISFISSTAELYSKSIITDKKVQKNIKKYKDEPSKFDALSQIETKEQIHHIIQSTAYIDFVSIYSVDKELILTTSSKLDIPTQISESENASWYIIEKDGKRYLSLSRPFYDVKSGSILGYIQIAINDDEIYKIYSSKKSKPEEIFILCEAISLDDGSNQSTYYTQLNTMGKYDEFISKIGDYFAVNYMNDKGTSLLQGNFPKSKTSGYIHQVNSPLYFFKRFDSSPWYIVKRMDSLQFFSPTIVNFLLVLALTILGILIGLYLAKKLEIELIKSEADKNSLEMELLQAQIKPHFLYNTLDNILALSDLDEKEKLSDLVINLSTFYRGSLSGGQKIISLKEELAISIAYLKILQTRYPEKFNYEIACDEALYNSLIPKLLLQPILENSIYHGIKEIPYKGLIKVRIRKEKNDIIIEVRDNGKGITEDVTSISLETSNETNSSHYGINNINKRIKLQYGSNYGISIANAPDGGCITKIRIGYETKNTNS